MIKRIMPLVAQAVSGPLRRSAQRNAYELGRLLKRDQHILHVFVQISDPYSYLLLQVLPELRKRYGVNVAIHSVLSMHTDMYPDIEHWRTNAVKDAARLAALYNLSFPEQVKTQPIVREHAFTARLLELERKDSALASAIELFDSFWQGLSQEDYSNDFDRDVFKARLEKNEQLREQLGHYFAAMIYYAGEWYWGLDRLDHLEKRLNGLGLSKADNDIKYDLQYRHFCQGHTVSVKQLSHTQYQEQDCPKLEIFYSARSPYSYLGLKRASDLAEHYGIECDIKPVLPMVMRGMQVPQSKKMYIFLDTKREAEKFGIPYGKVADPLGAGVERCYALFEYAKSEHKELEFLRQFGRAVNSQGIHSDTNKGLRRIVERSGLSWSKTKGLLANEDWREWAGRNQEELSSMGLWGVPCFRFGDTIAWGQDRLWVIEQAINEWLDDL